MKDSEYQCNKLFQVFQLFWSDIALGPLNAHNYSENGRKYIVQIWREGAGWAKDVLISKSFESYGGTFRLRMRKYNKML